MYISLSDRPKSQRPKNQRRGPAVRRRVAPTVLVLGVVSLLTDISSESVSAILPLYLTGVLGLSAVAFGLVDGLYQGVSALVRLWAGWLSDRTNRPKWVAVAGYGLSAVARVFFLVATTGGAVAAVVAADRVGKGIRTAPRDAMISASTPPDSLGYAFGVHRTLDTVGAAIGPFLAAAILWLIPDGYRTVMVVSLGFAVVGVALLVLLGPDQRARRVAEPVAGRVEPPFRWRDLTDPRLRRLLLVAGPLALLTIGDGFVYLGLLERGGFGAQWFPLLYVGTNVAYLLAAIPIGRLADRVGRARVLLAGHVALVAAYLSAVLPASGQAATAAVTILALAFLGVFYAATDGVTAALAGQLVPERARTSGIAAAQTVVAVARMVAAAGFGVLWVLLGPGPGLVVVAVLLAAVIAVATTQVGRIDRAPQP